MSGKPAIASILALIIAWPAAAQQSAAPSPSSPAAPAGASAPAADPDRLAPPATVAEDPHRWSLAGRENMQLGVGLFSVGGHFVRDRQSQGREPLSGTGGRENRVAAVGFSLRF
jgi:hypothetical protein